MTIFIKDTRLLIDERLRMALKPTLLTVNDESALHAGHAMNSVGGHYLVTIVSSRFNGKSRLVRHRIVYNILSDVMQQSRVHALSIRAYTFEEFNKS
ncbi:MAG: BolA family protein [Burkholderia sp.]|nr:BolA family protein [Burkholderia sp.]